MEGEENVFRCVSKDLFVRLFEGMQRLFSSNGAGVYEQANQTLLDAYLRCYKPDGQILFLAAAPARKAKGTGTFLLRELERREPDKQIYLFTDDACTYPFYEHRGFQRTGEKAVELVFSGKRVPLTCFLYSKRIPRVE